MNKIITLSLLFAACACLNANAGTVFDEQAKADLKLRLEIQPQLKNKIDISKYRGLSAKESEALGFIYAYASTPDILDYDSDFWIANVRASLKAAEEMPWGKKIPDREWKHFVLPVRVNNENLDMSRVVFYDELKDRIKNMSMTDAILEVNHWCHEKVSYQPSDARTSAPLATVRNALGRCGEESTFTVAALRSVGIPARQVYTPRWAHTDDNHAWVEAWADGKWHFIGACEPEPVLDLAWFNAPASRGMLMNTKVFGAYDGPEEILDRNHTHTVINVTGNYAPTEIKRVVVQDIDGNPVQNATVNFSLYNYAEFYPIATKTTDKNGYAELTTGKGDIIAWGSDGSRFGIAKSNSGDTINLKLDKDNLSTGILDFDITPPHSGGKLPTVAPEAIASNELRKVKEDSIRNRYTSSFISPSDAIKITDELNLDSNTSNLITASRGNHQTIVDFLRSIPSGHRKKAEVLLSVISDKDLHDITTDVLEDHIATPETDSKFYDKYILNPRIENEMLTPYKEFFRKSIPEPMASAYSGDPETLVSWMKQNIVTDTLYNTQSYRMSPQAVWENKTADPLSKSIAFVAICRSIGVPARIDPVSHATQYIDKDGNWRNVDFSNDIDTEPSKTGKLYIHHDSANIKKEPKYLSQFTISKINNGLPDLLEFGDFEPVSSINNRNEQFSPGQYAIVSGQRMADGSVLSRIGLFSILSDRPNDIDLSVRQDSTALQVIGSFNAESTYLPMGSKAAKSIISTTGRGYYALGIIKPGHEPSSHALNDLAAAATELESTGRKILLIFPNEADAAKFNIKEYGKLPSNVEFGIDVDNSISSAIKEGLETDNATFPVFIVADTFNRVIFISQGYTIHLGEQLFNVFSQTQE